MNHTHHLTLFAFAGTDGNPIAARNGAAAFPAHVYKREVAIVCVVFQALAIACVAVEVVLAKRPARAPGNACYTSFPLL